MRRIQPSSYRSVLASSVGVLAVAACAGMEADLVHPPELVGTWVQLRADGTWGDTVAYLADGRVVGSASRPASASEQWVVVRSKTAGEGLCVGDPLKPRCHPFRLAGDTLTRGPFEQPTYFRRAR